MNRGSQQTVGVVAGGRSGEREISLRTGRAAEAALRARGHRTVFIDAGPDLPEVLRRERIGVVFNALHGTAGEDGVVQGLLEWMEIPYTGSGVEASAVAMDKALSAQLAQAAGLTVPPQALLEERSLAGLEAARRRAGLGWPLVVKPVREGSSLGYRRLASPIEAAAWMEGMKEEPLAPSEWLAMAFVEGREVTVSVLDGQPLPVIEIRPRSGEYDFRSKYTVGATEYLCPAPIGAVAAERTRQDARTIHRRLDCRGATRSDFILDAREVAWFLEINTLPGMTATSLLPKAAKEAGLEFEDLVEALLASASLKRR